MSSQPNGVGDLSEATLTKISKTNNHSDHNRIGLCLGNSFAEASWVAANDHNNVENFSSVQSRRWFLSRPSFSENILQIFRAMPEGFLNQPTRIFLSSNRPRWAEARINQQRDLPASLLASPLSSSALALPPISEIENSTSQANVANDEIAEPDEVENELLTPRTSAREATADVTHRLETLWQEELAAVRKVASELSGGLAEVIVWTQSGATANLQITRAQVCGGVEKSLANYFAREDAFEAALKDQANLKQTSRLIFGLEDFYFESSSGAFAPLTACQPTAEVTDSSWRFLDWGGMQQGYEPGPMIFGRSRRLTVLDVLALGGRLGHDVPALSDRLQEKALSRIQESIYTLAKDLGQRAMPPSEAFVVAMDLELSMIRMIASEAVANAADKPFEFCGPLSATFCNLVSNFGLFLNLTSRRENRDWCLSLGALSGGTDS